MEVANTLNATYCLFLFLVPNQQETSMCLRRAALLPNPTIRRDGVVVFLSTLVLLSACSCQCDRGVYFLAVSH